MEIEWNAHVSEPYELVDGITVHLLQENNKPRMQLVLVVEEWTKKTNVYNHWGRIEESLGWLSQIQGSDLTVGYQDALFDIALLHDKGMGYGETARFLNFHMLALLYRAFHEHENGKNGDAGWFGLYTYFIAFGENISHEDYGAILDEYFELINQGSVPWGIGPKDSLFTWLAIKERIRYFNIRVRKGTLKITDHQRSKNTLELEQADLWLGGWYDKAMKVLKHKYQADWRKYESWERKLLQQISLQVEQSDNLIIQELRSSSNGV